MCSEMPMLSKSIFSKDESDEIKISGLSGFISPELENAPIQLPLFNEHR